MKNRKTRLIMGIMVGLVLFSSSVALLLYLKQTGQQQSAVENIEVFVAAKNIKKGELLDAHSIKKAHLPKSYISFSPLQDSEIMHRYARVNIYKDEPIRQEKISINKPEQESKKTPKQAFTKKVQKDVWSDEDVVEQISKDTISVSLSLFKNQNTPLKAGDYVDIVSVIPSSSSKSNSSFSTKYIALHVQIQNFLHDTQIMKKMIRYQEKKQPLRANAVVLIMSPKEIKNFLTVYYKTQQLNNNRVYNANGAYGGQLWLIKTTQTVDKKLQAEKSRLLIDRKIYKKQYKRPQEKVRISYEQ
jgi:Flp pilus assembly protein CpaB